MNPTGYAVEKHGRHWAVYEVHAEAAPTLVVVAVYQRGAAEVARRLESAAREARLRQPIVTIRKKEK